MSAAKTYVVSAAKKATTSAATSDISISSTTLRQLLRHPRGVVDFIGMSDVATDGAAFLAADTTDVLAPDTTDVLAGGQSDGTEAKGRTTEANGRLIEC